MIYFLDYANKYTTMGYIHMEIFIIRARLFSQTKYLVRTITSATVVFTLTTVLALATDDSSHSQMDHSKHKKLLQQATQHQTVSTVASLSIPETTLTAQDGQKVKIVEDLIKDKVVLLNTIYTSCTTICSPMGANFTKLQNLLIEQLGENRLRNEVALLSISIDPVNDTPQRLKAWKQKFGGKPGWTLLTGSQADVDKLLKATGLFTADFVNHAPIALLGDAQKDQWNRVSALAPPSMLAQMIADQLDTNAHTQQQQ